MGAVSCALTMKFCLIRILSNLQVAHTVTLDLLHVDIRREAFSKIFNSIGVRKRLIYHGQLMVEVI